MPSTIFKETSMHGFLPYVPELSQSTSTGPDLSISSLVHWSGMSMNYIQISPTKFLTKLTKCQISMSKSSHQPTNFQGPELFSPCSSSSAFREAVDFASAAGRSPEKIVTWLAAIQMFITIMSFHTTFFVFTRKMLFYPKTSKEKKQLHHQLCFSLEKKTSGWFCWDTLLTHRCVQRSVPPGPAKDWRAVAPRPDGHVHRDTWRATRFLTAWKWMATFFFTERYQNEDGFKDGSIWPKINGEHVEVSFCMQAAI